MLLPLALFVLSAGHGVDEPPAGHTLFRDEQHAVLGAWTSYGLLEAADGLFLWTPEEAVPADFVWDAYRVADSFLVATSTGVYQSKTGCDWDRQLTGAVVRFAQSNTRLYAAVQNLGAAGGLAFIELSAQNPTWRPSVHWRKDLVIEAIETSNTTMWVSGFDGAAFFVARIRGDEWMTIATSATRRVLLLVDDTGLWVNGNNKTHRLDLDGQALFSLPQRFVDARGVPNSAAGTTEFLNENGERFVYEETLQGPKDQAVRFDGDAVVFDVTQSQAHFQIEGEALIEFAKVRPRTCEAGSAAFAVSSQAWPILQAQGVGPRPSVGPKSPADPPDNGGCNSSKPRTVAVLSLWLAWGVLRRQKIRRTDGHHHDDRQRWD